MLLCDGRGLDWKCLTATRNARLSCLLNLWGYGLGDLARAGLLCLYLLFVGSYTCICMLW